METRIWHKAEEKLATVLVMTGDAIHRFQFTGKNAAKEANEVATAVAAGQDPAKVALGKRESLPLSAIKRVEVSHGKDTVKFKDLKAEKPVKIEFTPEGDDAREIALAVIERAGIAHPEGTEDIGVFEALIGPLFVAVIAGVAFAFVYNAATTLDSGQEIDTDTGGRKGRGLKRTVVFFARMLGTNGTIAVGVIMLILVLAWGTRLVVKRPQRIVWGPPAV